MTLKYRGTAFFVFFRFRFLVFRFLAQMDLGHLGKSRTENMVRKYTFTPQQNVFAGYSTGGK